MAFGCIIGWGCFVMPATNFLPKAGVAGSLLGLGLAAAFAMVICYNYYCLVKVFPGTASTYQLIRRALGPDYAFFVIWSLLLAYMSIFWANSSAMAAMGRFFIKDSGAVYLYTFMGHDVCLSDLIIAVFMVIISVLAVRRGYRRVLKIMSLLAGVLLVSVAALFIGMLMHADASALFYPGFSPSTGMSKGSQIMTVVVLAPWLFVKDIYFSRIRHSLRSSDLFGNGHFFKLRDPGNLQDLGGLYGSRWGKALLWRSSHSLRGQKAYGGFWSCHVLPGLFQCSHGVLCRVYGGCFPYP